MSKLPILMYHNVTEDSNKVGRLTIDVKYLEQQFEYLASNGYRTYHFSDLEQCTKIAKRSVVITFDDITVNQKEYVISLLDKYKLKASFFIPFAYIGGSDDWNRGNEPIMSIEEIKSLGTLVELGFHSYKHGAYSKMAEEEINDDFEKCFAICKENNLKVYPALAYPYGNFPKNEPEKSAFFKLVNENKMMFGLRIGNKRNRFPFRNPYEINRIDVRGNESFWKFKLNLKFGKLF